MTFLAAFFAALIFVGLRSFQQLNVVHRKYLLIIPTSMTMAWCEGYVIVQMAHYYSASMVLTVGLGAGLGCILATYLHHRYVADRSEG